MEYSSSKFISKNGFIYPAVEAGFYQSENKNAGQND